MPAWKQSDLHIVDPIKAIRRDCDRYGLADHRGERLACRLLADAVFSGVRGAEVHRSGDWWIVQAREDWLVLANRFHHPKLPGDLTTKALFHRIVEFPKQGRFHPRAEVFLTALAEAVVTSGSDGVTWISGEGHRETLPAEVKLSPLPADCGRIVAFKLPDG